MMAQEEAGGVRVEEQGGELVGGRCEGKAAKTLLVAMAGTTGTVLTTSDVIATSLPRALFVAYVALFLTTFLFLAILLVILLCARGCGGRGAVTFAERSAMAVMFVVPLLALAMKVYAVLN